MILKNIFMETKTVFFIIIIAKSADGIGGRKKHSLIDAQNVIANLLKGNNKAQTVCADGERVKQ